MLMNKRLRSNDSAGSFHIFMSLLDNSLLWTKKYFEMFFLLFVHHYYKTLLKLHESIIKIQIATQRPYKIYFKNLIKECPMILPPNNTEM